MIRFLLKVDEKEKISSLLSASRGDYVTILVNMHGSYFMVDSSELYVHRMFIHLERNGITEPFCFRIDKKKFLSLLAEGTVEFRILDEKVTIVFKNVKGENLYKYVTLFEQDTYEKFSSKLELLQNVYDYPTVDITKLGELIRIARSLGTSISCIDNIAFIRLPSVGIFVNNESTNFTVSGNLLAFMQKYSMTLRNAQNYLAYKSENTAILLTKYRDAGVNEFQFIDSQKSAFKISFIINHMIDLCKRLKFSEGEFILDLEEGIATFKEERDLYETEINITNIVSAKIEKEKKRTENEELSLDDMFNAPVDEAVSIDYGIPKLIIPSTILRNVLCNINSLRELVLYVKKNFIQISIGQMNIVFGRSEL